MTRKNYIALADALGLEIRNSRNDEETHGILRAINAIAPVLKADNTAFDKRRFVDHVYAVAEGRTEITT